MTICPLTAYKTVATYFNMENVLNNTFEMEQVFSPATILLLKNESIFYVQEVYSLMLGRCFMITRYESLTIWLNAHTLLE